MKPIRVITIGLWALAAAAVGGFVVASTTGNAPDTPAEAGPQELPNLFEFADFELTSHRNETFTSADVDGEPWVGFIFLTNCPTGACPVMVDKMDKLQDAIPDDSVQFVSFSVDPDRDTPETMTRFVKAVTGDEPGDRWHLLTGGTREGMAEFARKNMLGVGEDFTHSTRFLLVDGTGTVRGLYGNEEPGGMERLAADAKQLLAEGA